MTEKAPVMDKAWLASHLSAGDYIIEQGCDCCCDITITPGAEDGDVQVTASDCWVADELYIDDHLAASVDIHHGLTSHIDGITRIEMRDALTDHHIELTDHDGINPSHTAAIRQAWIDYVDDHKSAGGLILCDDERGFANEFTVIFSPSGVGKTVTVDGRDVEWDTDYTLKDTEWIVDNLILAEHEYDCVSIVVAD